MNATHQRKVLLMNNITGELYNVEGVITSIMIHQLIYIYINLLETQLRTSLAIVGDSIVLTAIFLCYIIFVFLKIIISYNFQSYTRSKN